MQQSDTGTKQMSTRNVFQFYFCFVKYIFFSPDKGFYCGIAGGGVQNV